MVAGYLVRTLAAAVVAVSAASAANVPRPAPAFSFTLQGGHRINLSDYKGKVVVLAFVRFT